MRNRARVVLVAIMALVASSCSVLDNPTDDAASSTASSVVEAADNAGDEAVETTEAPPTEEDIRAELQELYQTFGIAGEPIFEDGRWLLTGTAVDQESRSQFVGAARRVDGVNITRDQIVVAAAESASSDEGADDADAADDGEIAAAEDDESAASASDTSESSSETLPRTGATLTLVLSLLAAALLLFGQSAMAWSRRLWFAAQATNCFRVMRGQEVFDVTRARRPRRR